jgi:hypothetical protein
LRRPDNSEWYGDVAPDREFDADRRARGGAEGGVGVGNAASASTAVGGELGDASLGNEVEARSSSFGSLVAGCGSLGDVSR